MHRKDCWEEADQHDDTLNPYNRESFMYSLTIHMFQYVDYALILSAHAHV